MAPSVRKRKSCMLNTTGQNCRELEGLPRLLASVMVTVEGIFRQQGVSPQKCNP